ncbi:MAG: response regulator transcription factor [Candidatus Acidiferrales bacterium]
MSTVLIAEDNGYTRAALRTFVETKTGFRVCGEAANGVQALEMANQFKPDVVLMDLLMPLANGIEAASAIRSVLPKTRIVIITMFPDLVGKSMTKMAGIDLVVDKTKCAPGLLAAFKTLFSNVHEPPATAPQIP